ncbi:MAG: hypothetical protein AAGE43_08945 [Pseudomonadota bacterium]
MSAHTASLLNAVLLILISAWAYLAADTPSLTALIPAVFGALLLICAPGVKRENKIVSHIAVLLTLIILIALFMPLRGALGRGDPLAVLRVGIMLGSTLVALVFFVRSFIAARRSSG